MRTERKMLPWKVYRIDSMGKGHYDIIFFDANMSREDVKSALQGDLYKGYKLDRRG